MTDGSMQPDSSAVRVALWRAQHALLDAPPHVLDDQLGLLLADPGEGWEERPDVHPRRTARNRASIVARAPPTEDLVLAWQDRGVTQYLILGAGLDTFALRHPRVTERVSVFEVDQPETQRWKQDRLAALQLAPPPGLHFVPVDFERDGSWLEALANTGFEADRPAVVASLGVAVYLTHNAVEATLRDVAGMATGTTLVMSFMIPLDDVEPDERDDLEGAFRGAAASGTPWRSFFTPDSLCNLAVSAGLTEVRHIAPTELARRYFDGRDDGLRPSSLEHLLVAEVGARAGTTSTGSSAERARRCRWM